MKTKLDLSAAHSGSLQDAWHYAMMLINRCESTFDGDREFSQGVRGQMLAYERLLGKIGNMSADNETWQCVKSQWWTPETFEQVIENAKDAMENILVAAARLGIDARTGEKLMPRDAGRPDKRNVYANSENQTTGEI